MAMETAAARLCVRIYDSFRNEAHGTFWDHEILSEYREDPTKSNLVLVKLHGSVNGVAQYEAGKLGTPQKIPVGMPRDPGGFSHIVLYPTLGSKDVRVEPYRTGYDCFRQCLRSANLLVAIGSSFRDPELNDEIRRGLSGASIKFRPPSAAARRLGGGAVGDGADVPK
jgi:hypothetical protein